MPQRLIPALALSAAAACLRPTPLPPPAMHGRRSGRRFPRSAFGRHVTEKASAVVDPFGSKSFGLALVIGTPKGSKTAVTQICVYDKHKKTVELGGELTPETVTIKAPAKAR